MKFSVVIPTRNRAALLPHAIKSAVGQDFDDYEIIVSNNYSQDGTEDVVGSFDSPLIKYYKTDRAMSMPDHWEYALSKASGEWVLFLCDDDALLPDHLSYLDSMIADNEDVRVFQYSNIAYVYDDGIEDNGNYIYFRVPIPSSVERIDSHAQLKRVFKKMSGNMPKFLNAAVSMELVNKIKEKHGRVFHNWAPDFAAGILLLAYTDSYLYLNRPLLVAGVSLRSYGPGARADPSHLLELLREFEEFDGQFTYSPYPELLTIHNSLFDTFYRTRSILGDDYKELEVDPLRFRRLLIYDIQCYLDNGYLEYAKYAKEIGDEVNAMSSITNRLLFMMWKTFDKLRRFPPSKKAMLMPMTRRAIYGNENNRFENIYQAAEVFSKFNTHHEA